MAASATAHTQQQTSGLIRSARALTFAACGLMTLSAYSFRPGQSEGLTLGFVLALLGGVTLAFALRAAPRTEPEPSAAVSPRVAPSWYHWGTAGLGGLCLLLLAESNGGRLHLPGLPSLVQFSLLLAGIGLCICGLGGFAFSRPDKVLVLITLVALLVRVWALEDAVHMFIDETNFVDAIIHLQREPQTQLLTPFSTIASFTWVYPYIQTLSTNMFGNSLTALRMVSVVLGTLTIPALYLLAKNLFDRKTALLAALFLATFPPHVHFSRLGMNNIADPFFGTLALAFLVRGAKHRRPRDYGLAGIMLGLTQYFYEGGRLLFPALVVISILTLALRQRAGKRSIALLMLAVAVTAAPIYYTQLAQRLTLVPRLTNNAWEAPFWVALLLASTDDPVLNYFVVGQVEPPLLHLFHAPDASGIYYMGTTPLILGYLVPAFLLGIVHACWRKPAAGGLLLLWIVFTVLGNSLLKWNNWTPRFVVLFPALCLLIALGVRYSVPLLLPQRTRLLGALALLLAVPQLVYYFGPHLEVYNQQIRGYRDHQDVMFRAAEFPPDTQVHFISNDLVFSLHVETLKRFWNLDMVFDVQTSEEFIRDTALDMDVDHAFFFEPANTAVRTLLRRRYHLSQPPEWSPYNVPRDRQYLLLYYHAIQ
jgi:hypothetical protein